MACEVLFACALFFNCSTKNEPVGVSDSLQTEKDHIITFGGTKNESAESITKTLDGGYAILGYTQSLDGDIENKTNIQNIHICLTKPSEHRKSILF